MPKQKIDLSKLEGEFTKPSKYIKFHQGENRIRILSEPYQYYILGKRTANGYIQHVIEDGVEVPEFFQGIEPKLMFGFVVFSHESGHFHVLETGSMLGVPLVELVRQHYPEEFKALDILVSKQGEKLKTKYTAHYAKDNLKLPEGVSKDSAEFRFILAYFEGLR